MRSTHALPLLLALFLIMGAVSWQTWATPEVDSGREMHTPLRLLEGDRLYSDVYYLYGPVAPYFNAAMYRLFGIHLNTLYAAGFIASLLLVLMAYHLGRTLMAPFESLLAAAAIVLFCVFKQSGNLIFPYTYAALYGTCLSTGALVLLVRYLRRYRLHDFRQLAIAGGLSGLACCCKLEFGFAAAAALIPAVLLTPRGWRCRAAAIAGGCFTLIPVLLYGLLLLQSPPAALFTDTYIFPASIPEELRHFNKLKLGLFAPLQTLREMISALALLGGLAGAILLRSRRAAGLPITGSGADPQARVLGRIALACLGWLLLHLLLFGTDWDLNPLRALPVLLAGMLVALLHSRGRMAADASRPQLLLLSVFSLAVLARVMIRVPGGGAYGSGLLPIPLLLFFYLATVSLPDMAPSDAARRHTHRTIQVFLSAALLVAAGIFSFRALTTDRYRLETSRGTLRLERTAGEAIRKALDHIAEHSVPGQFLLALPEGSSLNFLGQRPAPLRYEILTPGFLTEKAERQAVRELQKMDVPLVFLFNRPTDEFGPKAFGRNYYRILMSWIEVNYEMDAVFGDTVAARAGIGAPGYFIRCYRRKSGPPPSRFARAAESGIYSAFSLSLLE